MLENLDIYIGAGYGAKVNIIGEIVFNTSITGYQEVITDPSYKGQIILFTHPHIGNVGTCIYDNESITTWAKAIITREKPTKPSNWRSEKKLEEYLLINNIPGIAEVDTRKLTKTIRDQENLIGIVVRDMIDPQEALEQILVYKDNNLCSNSLFSSYESKKQILDYGENNTGLHIALLDLGCKISILNMLKKFNCKISVLNSDCVFDKIKQLKPDAVVLSNGPGNPNLYVKAINLIRDIIKEAIPTLGICLGHQLLCLALGAKVKKLQFGHHGINHPVKDLETNEVFITSQNHNYIVDPVTLPSNVKVTHISLFDNSIQGFSYNKNMIMGFQGHPEGGPGPIDIQGNIVKKFLTLICVTK